MDKVMEIYKLLLDCFGPQRWWPADSPFEVIAGAILMPQTSWRNVERALDNLKRAGMLDPRRIADSDLRILTSFIKPAGLHRSKPHRLRRLCRHITHSSGGDVGAFLARGKSNLRTDLLSLEGIGPETADSILLYAAKKKVFVVDAYTVRIGARVGLFEPSSYDDIQRYFEARVVGGIKVYQEYHALLVALAKNNCRPKPRCAECPVNAVCARFLDEKSPI